MANNYGSDKELESDKHWPRVELSAFLARSPSDLHFLPASKAEATHRSGESSGIQRPGFEPWLSSSWLWVLQPPFSWVKSVLWGRKDSTVKGLDHSACLINRGWYNSAIFFFSYFEWIWERRWQNPCSALHVSLSIILSTDIDQGSEKWNHVQCIIGCMTCAVTQSPRLKRFPRLV